MTVLSSFLPPPPILSAVQGQKKMQHRRGAAATLAEFNSWAFMTFLPNRQTSRKTHFHYEKQTMLAEPFNRALTVGLEIKEKKFSNLYSASIV